MLRPEDSDMARQIGQRAKALRQRLPAMQEEVAERVGLSPQVYARLERGGVLPSVPSLMRLCEVLRARPNDLLVDVPSGDAGRLAGLGARGRPMAGRLAQAVAAVDEETARILLPLMRRLARGVRKARSGSRG